MISAATTGSILSADVGRANRAPAGTVSDPRASADAPDGVGRDLGFDECLGGGLDAMIDAIAACDVLIAGDTGPLHIARALGIPTVALFGPTDERRHDIGPRDRVLTVELDCRPCSPHGHDKCPLDHHRCLRDLEAAQVQAALREVFAE